MNTMTVKDIEFAITQLPHDEIAEFAEWFEEFEAQRWDNEIEHDSNAGRFDSIIEHAKAEHDAGQSRSL